MAGPIQWFLDASAVKNTKITERVVLRFNVDLFNALNNPNNPAGLSSATNAILSTRNSGSAARSMQLGARLIW